MDLKELYQEIILDHGKSPRNKKKCDGFNKEAEGYNPLCGDKVHVFLKLDDNKKVSDVSFEGEGCAISMASASIMTEIVKGKDFDIAKKIISEFLTMIREGSKITINNVSKNENVTMKSLSGVKEFPMRVKCATLAWHTFISATEGKKETVNTEKID